MRLMSDRCGDYGVCKGGSQRGRWEKQCTGMTGFVTSMVKGAGELVTVLPASRRHYFTPHRIHYSRVDVTEVPNGRSEDHHNHTDSTEVLHVGAANTTAV